MADNADNGSPPQQEAAAGDATEHLNIKVTDNNNEVFFKIKRSTKLQKLMTAFCHRQGKSENSVRFLFEGQRVQPTDTPDTVGCCLAALSRVILADAGNLEHSTNLDSFHPQLEMQDGDTLEVHQEQVGGCAW